MRSKVQGTRYFWFRAAFPVTPMGSQPKSKATGHFDKEQDPRIPINTEPTSQKSPVTAELSPPRLGLPDTSCHLTSNLSCPCNHPKTLREKFGLFYSLVEPWALTISWHRESTQILPIKRVNTRENTSLSLSSGLLTHTHKFQDSVGYIVRPSPRNKN